jgi:hypothetical protein
LLVGHRQPKPLPPCLLPRQAIVTASHHQRNKDNRGTSTACLCPLICCRGGGGGTDNNNNSTLLSTLTQSSLIVNGCKDNNNDAIGGTDVCIWRSKQKLTNDGSKASSSVKLPVIWELPPGTNEEMTMTATGDDANVGGEGCNNDNDCGLTSADNKQQST